MSKDPHEDAGPKAEKYVGSVPTMHRAACSCGWEGPARVTRWQAAADHRLHTEREAADLRQDIEWDRTHDADL